MAENKFACSKNKCVLKAEEDCTTCAFNPAEAERRIAILRKDFVQYKKRKEKKHYQLILNKRGDTCG